MTLYELTNDYQNLLEMAEDPDIDPVVLADTMDAIEGEIEIKADGYARIIRQMEADAAALKAEADRITNRRRVIENNIRTMKNRLEDAMIATGKVKFKTELFSFGIQKNPARVVIDDPTKIPAGFLIPQEPKIDTAAIKNSLKDADEQSFWEGVAHLEQDSSLRIR